MSGEDVSRDKFEHLSVAVCPSGDSLNLPGHIIYRYQNVLFPF